MNNLFGSAARFIQTLPQNVAAGIYNPVAGLYNKAVGQLSQPAQPAAKGNLFKSAQLGAAKLKNTFISPEALSAGSEAAATAVPFGRGASFLTKSLLPGAVSGGVYQAGQPGATPQNVGESALFGAGTAGLFQGAGSLVAKGMSRLDGLIAQHPQIQTGKVNFGAPVSIPAFHGEGTGRSPMANMMQGEPNYGAGKYYSTNPDYAGVFGKVTKENVPFKNPLIITDQNQFENYMKQAIGNNQTIDQWARAQGHDGIYNHLDETLVKFNPTTQAQHLRFLKTPTQPQNIPGQVENPTLDLQRVQNRITEGQNNQAAINASRIEASRATLQSVKPSNSLADFEKSVASSPKETQAYFDKNGNKVYQTESGGTRTARMPVEDQGKLTGAVVSSHNHQLVDKANPTSRLNQIATAPDKYDMQQALSKGIKEVRTVHPNGTTSVKFPDNLDQAKIGQAIHQSTIDGENAYRAALAKGEQPYYANVARVEAENNAMVKGLGAKVITTANKAAETTQPVAKAPVIQSQQPNPIQKASTFLNSKQGQKGGINFFSQIGKFFGKKTSVPVQPKAPSLPTGTRERGFVTTVKESPNAPQQLRDLVSGTYDVKANDTLKAAANARIMKDPVAATHFATTKNTDEATATAIQLVKQLTAKGDFQTAADIANTKAEQLTEAGRTIQAASLFDSLSPEGIAQMAAKTIQKYNITARQKIPELTGEQLAKFTRQAAVIKALPAGSRVQDMARQKMLESIARLTPTGPISKGLGIWRAGLLTGPQTVTKIITSHAAMAGLEYLKNLPAKAVDEVLSVFTGQRGLTPTLKGIRVGTRQGITDALDNFLHGYEAPHSGGFAHDFKNTVNYGDSFFGKVTQNYVDGIGRLHGSLYKPFFGGAHLNSLYDQALTTAANQHLTGDAAKRFVLDFVKNPPKDAMDIADKEAQYATFQQKTFLGQIASGFQRKAGPAGKIIAPFTRIPSAILTDVVDYSPAGIAKSIIQTINKGQFTQANQRELSQGLGRSITGTGLVAIGAALYNQGMIALDRPTTGKAAAQWDLEGKKAQSIKIDGQWKNLASLGPLGHVLGMGGYFQQGMVAGGLSQAIGSTTLGAAKITLDQPYLTQLSNISQAVQSPQQKALQEGKSLASSVVPTVFGTVARATDPLQRETNTIPEAVATKIPGLRQTLIPRTNVFGSQIPRSGSMFQNLVDPFQSYTDTSGQATGDAVTTELGRLNASGFPATPVKLNKNETLHGVKSVLAPDQLSQLNQTMGPQVKAVIAKVIASPEYQQMTDEEKAATIGKVVAKTHATVRTTFNQANPKQPLQAYKKPSTVKARVSHSKSLFSSGKSKGLFKTSHAHGLL